MKTFADECLERAMDASLLFNSQECQLLLKQDLPELARRLKIACEAFRELDSREMYYQGPYGRLADELEKPLEGK